MRRKFAVAFAALLLAASPALARSHGYGSFSHGYYRSSDGAAVRGPTRERSAAYGRVTADCRDGTFSNSHHHQGTCSGHGGVARWE